jgi:ferredoxin-NADP reductase/DMSO/TMAO reductase YedYZ heme-binding membrane subunit
MPFARFGLIVNAAVPLGLLIWDAAHHRLGADPVNFAIHTTGLTALIFLLLSLCVTPLRSVTGFAWLVQFRRSLGLYAFFYGCCHLAIYYWWDRGRNLGSTVHEITHRLYLLIGFTALSLMAPLAATSANFMIRWMGGKKWKALHRLAYLSAILGCIHYYMQVKADTRLPLTFFAVLAVLLGYRLLAFVVHRVSATRRAMPGSIAAAPGTAAKARFWKGELRVGGVFDETPNVRTFRLLPVNGESIPFRFSAGQFLNLSLVIDGKKVGRSYTIASPPTRDAYVELTIKREDRGHVSRYLHEMLMQGGRVSVSAPAGRFTFAGEPATPLLLIAGGVGVTPVMSILRDLTDRVWPGKIDLVFSARTRADIIFADELNLLERRHPNVHVHFTLSRESPTEWTGLRGRITAAMLKSILPDLQHRAVFICGPSEMAAAVKAELLGAGLAEGQIKVESFTPAAAVAADGGMSPAAEMAEQSADEEAGEAGTVTFVASGQSARLPANKSVLEAAESVGVAIDFDCRSGICGRCRTRLLSGQVTMAVQDALSDADIAEGFILACQAHASGDVSVDA